jgi:hypothetical protein
MHYRTPRVDFLDGVEPFIERMPHVKRVPAPFLDTAELEAEDTPLWWCPPRPRTRPLRTP